MRRYRYRCGLYIGRFQPIHVGHESIIRRMLDECEIAIIAIGSAQEGGTMKNPFTCAHRADLIENVFYRERIEGRLKIVPVNDRKEIANDASWGNYVFKCVDNFTHLTPDVIYEGEEAERATWYDELDVDVVRVPRNIIPVSATKLREAILKGPSVSEHMMLPRAIGYRVREMREVLLNAKQN